MNMIATTLLHFLLCIPFISTDDTNMSPPIEQKILFGRFSNIANVPFLATLERKGAFVCSASILSRDWLGSKIDCFQNIGDVIRQIQARVGSSFMLREGFTYSLADYRTHPNYSAPYLNNIALLKTARAMQFNSLVKDIQMQNNPPSAGQTIQIFGWGLSQEPGKTARNQIKLLNLMVLDKQGCRNFTVNQLFIISPTLFCSSITSAGLCMSDNSGPGVIGGKLAGLIAPGNNSVYCDPALNPIYLIKISVLIPWIKEITRIP